MTFTSLVILSTCLIFGTGIAKGPSVLLPDVKQCKEGDPNLLNCLIEVIHSLKPYLKTGIAKIKLPSIEPFQIDELSLALSTGSNEFNITFKHIEIYGASNYTVKKLKLSENGKPFDGVIKVPEMRISARYSSSGVLIIVPASGNGTFHATFSNITAKVQGKVSIHYKDDLKYLNVDTLNFDLDVGDVQMEVRDVFNNNGIMSEALNLFLRNNGPEVLMAIKPQLTKKLAGVFQPFANQLFTHIPVQTFFTSISSF